jgi:hypothetical protein
MIEAHALRRLRPRFPSGGRALLWVACLAGGIGLAGFISLASWVALSDGPLRDPESVEVRIPPGTAEAIQRGAAVSVIPGKLRFVQGDRLVLKNEDSVPHNVGNYSVGPGTSLTMPLDTASSSSFLCSFHPQGSIALDVRGRTSPLMVLFPTIVIGLPLGLVSAGVVEVTRRLQTEEQAAF